MLCSDTRWWILHEDTNMGDLTWELKEKYIHQQLIIDAGFYATYVLDSLIVVLTSGTEQRSASPTSFKPTNVIKILHRTVASRNQYHDYPQRAISAHSTHDDAPLVHQPHLSSLTLIVTTQHIYKQYCNASALRTEDQKTTPRPSPQTCPHQPNPPIYTRALNTIINSIRSTNPITRKILTTTLPSAITPPSSQC